jgi:hypothetical protein
MLHGLHTITCGHFGSRPTSLQARRRGASCTRLLQSRRVRALGRAASRTPSPNDRHVESMHQALRWGIEQVAHKLAKPGCGALICEPPVELHGTGPAARHGLRAIGHNFALLVTSTTHLSPGEEEAMLPELGHWGIRHVPVPQLRWDKDSGCRDRCLGHNDNTHTPNGCASQYLTTPIGGGCGCAVAPPAPRHPPPAPPATRVTHPAVHTSALWTVTAEDQARRWQPHTCSVRTRVLLNGSRPCQPVVRPKAACGALSRKRRARARARGARRKAMLAQGAAYGGTFIAVQPTVCWLGRLAGEKEM